MRDQNTDTDATKILKEIETECHQSGTFGLTENVLKEINDVAHKLGEHGFKDFMENMSAIAKSEHEANKNDDCIPKVELDINKDGQLVAMSFDKWDEQATTKSPVNLSLPLTLQKYR